MTCRWSGSSYAEMKMKHENHADTLEQYDLRYLMPARMNFSTHWCHFIISFMIDFNSEFHSLSGLFVVVRVHAAWILGALVQTNSVILPFGILSSLACFLPLSYARFSFAIRYTC